MTWTCDNCKNENPDRSEKCLKCGAEKGNREIDWDYVEETTNNVAEQHDEPCGIWLRETTDSEERE